MEGLISAQVIDSFTPGGLFMVAITIPARTAEIPSMQNWSTTSVL